MPKDPFEELGFVADTQDTFESLGFQPEVVKDSSVLERIKSAIDTSTKQRAKTISESQQALEKGEQGFARSAFQVGGQLVGGALDPFTQTVGAIIPEGVKTALSNVINFASNRISDVPAVQKFAQSSQGLERDLQAVNEYLALLAPESKGIVPAGVKTATTKAIDITSDFTKSLVQKSESQIENAITKKFEKGVKPLLPSKTTPNLLQNYRNDVIDAVKTIDSNRPNLKYTDPADGVTNIVGKNPESLQQFTDAIEQTKKTIFTKYNDLAKQSNKAGLKIETAPISKELDVVIGNEALKVTNPEAIAYAQNLQKRLAILDEEGNITSFKKLDPVITQEIVQNYNKSLEAFYRNPSYETASRAAIDALVANKFRQALDDGISGLTGKEYQALKNQYGSLKAIERDVIKATLRDARKNVKGLIDFTDVFSGGQVVSGIATLNPGLIASGLTQKAITEFYKYLNNPNRAIKNMFERVEKLPQSRTTKIKSLLQTQAPSKPPMSAKKKSI